MFNLIALINAYQRNETLKLVRFLTAKHIAPTNKNRIKIKWALYIFRPEMVAALLLCQEYGIPDLKRWAIGRVSKDV